MTPIAEIKVHNHGLVALMDTYGNNYRPAIAARTSYRKDASEYTDEQNDKLISYLVKNRHTTPLEFCGATFFMVMPIFVARQLVRHRTAAINEESLRYVDARDEFYVPTPEECLRQSTTNKQGAGNELVDDPQWCIEAIDACNHHCYEVYRTLLDTGLAKELARGVLPLNTYTGWYWSCDLHNILHLLSLRTHEHAQRQTREYAIAMKALLEPIFPTVFKAWEDKILNG